MSILIRGLGINRPVSIFLNVILVLLLASCATAHKISGVQLGMTRDQVVTIMGPPQSTSATGNIIYMNYALAETDDQAFYGVTKPYYVRLVDGRVDSYGRTGDFDSTKTPTVRVESDARVEETIRVEKPIPYDELNKLKDLKDSGVISEEEFEELKARLLELK